MQKTTTLTKQEAQDQRGWVLVDVEGQTLGRAASKIAHVLRGKHKPTFTPHVDCGDFVVVVNASKVKLTGNKLADKMYYHHSQYPGGIKSRSASELLAQDPGEMIRRAVWGMLPKGPLGRRIIKKLKVYAGSEHQHQAQDPKPLPIA